MEGTKNGKNTGTIKRNYIFHQNSGLQFRFPPTRFYIPYVLSENLFCRQTLSHHIHYNVLNPPYDIFSLREKWRKNKVMQAVYKGKKITGMLSILPETTYKFDDETKNFLKSRATRLKRIMGYEKRRSILRFSTFAVKTTAFFPFI